jgi:hypothetical protein
VAQQHPQAGDVGLHRAAGADRHPARPEPLGQLVGLDRPAGGHEQGGRPRTHLPGRNGDVALAGEDLERAEHPGTDGRGLPHATPRR